MRSRRPFRGDIVLRQMGSRGLLLQATGRIDLEIQRRIWALNDHLRTCQTITELTPGVGNILLLFEKPLLDIGRSKHWLRKAWDSVGKKYPKARIITVPVNYGGAFSADLLAVAKSAKMSAQAVIEAHSAAHYDVFCIASSPGYGYLFGVPPQIAIPRKRTPALSVPAGAVGIAGPQTGVSVLAGPNGWHILGQTDVKFFDIKRTPPGTLAPGDQVKFEIQSISI